MTKPKKLPSPSLLVTIKFHPENQPIDSWIMSAILEYTGIYYEYKKLNKDTHAISAIFENLKYGEDFYKMIENTKLIVSKEEC